MIVLCTTLRTEITNSFSLSLERVHHIKQVSVNLYMHNAPAGVFAFDIMNGSTVIESTEFTSSFIKGAFQTTDNFIHGFVPLLFNTKLRGGTYTARLRAVSGYSYSVPSFLGWKKDFDGFYPFGIEENPWNYPHSFRLVTYDDSSF